MRIAFYSDNFYPELSGITETIVTTGVELHKRGHEVVYVGPRYSRSDYAKANRIYPEHPDDDTIQGIPIVRLPSFPVPFSPTGQSRFAIPLGSSLAYLTDFRPEVIHTQSPYSVGWEAVWAARHLRVPLVGTNHTAVEDFFPFPALMRPYDAWYYNRCAFVTTPYARLIERMREAGLTRPAEVVPNPVDLTAFKPPTREEKEACRRAFGLTGPVVLYVGRLGVEKRVDVIVRAVAELVREFPTLTFVSTGHGAAENSLRSLAHSLGISERVRFTGLIPRAKLHDLFKTADVFAMMSTSDSQSLALMEAYATAVPAVCARARGLPDYTPEKCGFLVEPGDSTALARTLGLLLRDPGQREAMGRAARDYVERFTPDQIAEKWEAIFTRAMQGP